MAEPISWQVLEWLKARIEAIRVDDGYLTDIGAGPIALDRESMPEEDAATTIVLGTDFAPTEGKSTKKTHVGGMDITIEFQVPYASTESPMKLAHRARSDLLRVLSGDLFNAPPGFRSLDITGSSITPPEGGATSVVAQVTARAGLSEPLSPAA